MSWLLRIHVLVLSMMILAGCTRAAATVVEDPPVVEEQATVEAAPVSAYFINLNSIKRIFCNNETSQLVGTAFIVEGDQLVTAEHVIGDKPILCTIDSKPVKMLYRSKALDFSVVGWPTLGRQRYEIDCRGFITGQTYYAIGFPNHGNDFVVTPLTATADFADAYDPKSGLQFVHVRTLIGPIYPGMSGGPIINIQGKVVGTVQATSVGSIARSRELRDTYLCGQEFQKSTDSK